MCKPANDRSDYLSLHMQPVIPIFSINEAFVLYTIHVCGCFFFAVYSCQSSFISGNKLCCIFVSIAC